MDAEARADRVRSRGEVWREPPRVPLVPHFGPGDLLPRLGASKRRQDDQRAAGGRARKREPKLFEPGEGGRVGGLHQASTVEEAASRPLLLSRQHPGQSTWSMVYGALARSMVCVRVPTLVPHRTSHLTRVHQFVHTISAQERRKFGPLGWNVTYAFDESDLEFSMSILQRMIEADEVVPWVSSLSCLSGLSGLRLHIKILR